MVTNSLGPETELSLPLNAYEEYLVFTATLTYTHIHPRATVQILI